MIKASGFAFALSLALALGSFQALAQTPPAGGGGKGGCHAHGACKRIEAACQGAGFVAGQYKKGFGLWRDCVDPIIQGKTPTCEPGVACKPLPTNVNPADVQACKAACAKFGEGQVGG